MFVWSRKIHHLLLDQIQAKLMFFVMTEVNNFIFYVPILKSHDVIYITRVHYFYVLTCHYVDINALSQPRTSVCIIVQIQYPIKHVSPKWVGGYVVKLVMHSKQTSALIWHKHYAKVHLVLVISYNSIFRLIS